MICKNPLFGFNFISVRSFTLSSVFNNKIATLNPESLANNHLNSNKGIDHLIINKILLNQNISVTEAKLKELLDVKGVEMDLPIVKLEEKKLFAELAGKSKYKGFYGVYIFIHIKTGKKYVGSSNLLRRRMDYYFKGEFSIQGKFLPFLKKEGLGAFKLVIFKLDSSKFTSQDALILEQYFLLNKEFNLNTLRVVNAGSSKGEGVYVYDLTCNTLYYHAKSRIELKRVLKIHPETSLKYVDSKIPYLNKFLLLSFYIPTANLSNISIQELDTLMQNERKTIYKLGTRRSIPVKLVILKGNSFVDPSADIKEQALNFDSLTACIEYLRKLGLTIKRNTLTKYIKNGKVFHNFLCKYSDNSLPIGFKEVGLIIEEYKNVKIDLNPLNKVNTKNKPVLVTGLNLTKEFESITDLIRYFDTLGIKLDRKTINLRLKNGKIYKGYYFAYK